MASTSPSSSEGAYPTSKWPELWSNHQEQWRRLDDLEDRMEESAMRKRRRIANLLDERSTHRLSHLRLFVTHAVTDTSKMVPSPSPQWTLVVEGKLLVGHLDHKSVAQVERDAAKAAGVTLPDSQTMIARETTTTAAEPDTMTAEKALLPPNVASAVAAVGGSFSAASHAMQQQQQQQQQNAVLVRSTDRSQYRGVGEKEDAPVEPTRFTHFFDKMQVTFQTIHQPRPPPSSPGTSRMGATAAATTPPSKKQRGKNKRKSEGKKSASTVAAEQMRTLKSLTTVTDPTTMVWNRQDSPDSHAFHVKYQEPPKPQGKATHSVVATIELYPRCGPEVRYQPSAALARALFPQHEEWVDPEEKKQKNKRRPDTPTAQEGNKRRPIVTDNDIVVQPSLTMKEIVSAIFLYVSEKNLLDESDRSIIVNDKLLMGLFDVERMSFFELQQRLVSQNLISPLLGSSADDTKKPIVLTYVMTKDTASTPAGQEAEEEEEEDAANTSSVMTFDTSIYVCGLLHSRVRELMRRIKLREFEYTSSRTRARNMLATSRLLAPQEDLLVKSRIEQAVCGRGYTMDHVPVWLALAKAAPPQSEARAVALSDARTCVLLDRLQHHIHAAKNAWSVVDAITNNKTNVESGNQDVSEKQPVQDESKDGMDVEYE